MWNESLQHCCTNGLVDSQTNTWNESQHDAMLLLTAGKGRTSSGFHKDGHDNCRHHLQSEFTWGFLLLEKLCYPVDPLWVPETLQECHIALPHRMALCWERTRVQLPGRLSQTRTARRFTTSRPTCTAAAPEPPQTPRTSQVLSAARLPT